MESIRSMTLNSLISRLVAATTLCLALFTVASAQGANADYLPFSRSKLRRFILKKRALPIDKLRSGQPFVVSGVKMQEVEEEPGTTGGAPADEEDEPFRRLVFSGRDLSGKEWSIETDRRIFYDSIYEGDLDRNGVRDLVLNIYTGGNGLAPPTELLFLTFDRQGRPTLFTATGYFDGKDDHIFDLADMDGDGRAELLYMIFNQGYWITNLYRLRESRWSRVEGRFAGLNFPAYTRFTRRPNHKPVRPAPGRDPIAPDLIEENRTRSSSN